MKIVAIVVTMTFLGLSAARAADFCDGTESPVSEGDVTSSAQAAQKNIEAQKKTFWACAPQVTWKTEPVLTDNVSQLIPPGEKEPVGNAIARCEYPHKMVIAEAVAGCVAPLPDANTTFVPSPGALLKDFFGVEDTMSVSEEKNVSEDSTVHIGRVYVVRQREYDEKNHPLDMYSHISISYDVAHQELYAILVMDKVVADKLNDGRFLKKFKEVVHAYVSTDNGVRQLKADTDWFIWAANPSKVPTFLINLFWGKAKGVIASQDLDWRNELMGHLVSKDISPPLKTIQASK